MPPKPKKSKKAGKSESHRGHGCAQDPETPVDPFFAKLESLLPVAMDLIQGLGDDSKNNRIIDLLEVVKQSRKLTLPEIEKWALEQIGTLTQTGPAAERVKQEMDAALGRVAAASDDGLSL